MKIRQEGSNKNIFVTKRKLRGNESEYALALIEGISLSFRERITNIYRKGILIKSNKNISI